MTVVLVHSVTSAFFVKMYCNNAIFETAAVLFTQECISEGCPVKTAPGQNGPVSDSQNGPVSDSQNGPVSDSQNGPIQMTYLIITVYMDLYHKIIRFLFRFIFICSRCHEYKNPNPI